MDILGRILKASEVYRRQYGQLEGFWFWLRLRQHVWRKKGTLHKVKVPDLAHPILLRAGTTDISVFIQIFMARELAFELPYEPSVIIDAGANVGFASIYFANRFPKAKIVALEVDKDNFKLLEINTKDYPNITCLRNALWSGKKQLSIQNPMDEPWAFRVGAAIGDDPNSVWAIGVPDILKQFDYKTIDLLKIDIEGAEKELFSQGTNEWIHCIGTIAVELHDRIEPGCTEALRAAITDRYRALCQVGEYTVVHMRNSH
jgi:FkbM family methyltransferase